MSRCRHLTGGLVSAVLKVRLQTPNRTTVPELGNRIVLNCKIRWMRLPPDAAWRSDLTWWLSEADVPVLNLLREEEGGRGDGLPQPIGRDFCVDSPPFTAVERLAILERCHPQLHLTIYSASTSDREGEAPWSEHHSGSLEFTAFTFLSFILNSWPAYRLLLAQHLLFFLLLICCSRHLICWRVSLINSINHHFY